MIYRFGAFELDVAAAELRINGELLPLEPQVFALLTLLVENRDRLVSRDEIIDRVWDGRVVSDAALSSRIKSVRHALGDDGRAQRVIRTHHGRGFRFVAEVRAAQRTNAGPLLVSAQGEPRALPVRRADQRPSIAVLPFDLLGQTGPYDALAQAIPAELIGELSRLHWLFVTARGSSFRLRTGDATFEDIGRLLGTRYCLTGSLDITGRHITVQVELVHTADSGVVWAERFSGSIDDVHAIREQIRTRVVAALDARIPLHEAALARIAVPEGLDAWSVYHLGLQHMFRFNRIDNASAQVLFDQAVRLDPDFARAHAGLSFLHFQTAFLRHTSDIRQEISLARRCAERSIECDPLDPFANFTMGRSYWLEGNLGDSLPWLERAIGFNPNFAQGIYARAWTDILSGRFAQGRQGVDLAMELSPLDPLHYAMVATRGLSHIGMGEDAEGAVWTDRAARAPGAHPLIAMVAAASQALVGDDSRAGAWAANVRERNSALQREDFFRSFPIKDEQMRSRISGALARFGF